MTMNLLVNLVTGEFPLSNEILCLAMAISGSMTVRNGANRNNDMHWFHAFLRSTLAGYAGATFTNMFMGKPTSMFSNDVFFGSCLVGFAIVNWLPMGIGYHFCGTFLGVLLTAVFSQVFRVGGVAGFSDAAQNAFKDAPSKYYPTPVFGPILFPTLLGNMGGFLVNGVDEYLGKGMPWLFQQGTSCSTFYHFYAHDVEGYVGVALRAVLRPLAIPIMMAMGADEKEREDDALFAKFMIGLFMVSMGIVRMPHFLGPTFSPFTVTHTAVANLVSPLFGGKKKKVYNKPLPGSKKNKKKNQ